MPALIEVSGVAKTYAGSGARALDGVDLTVESGEILGLLGPNGAGKTTLLSVLLGLVRKDSGRITVAGLDVDRELPAIRRLCGLAPQDYGFYPTLTVAENLRFQARAGGLRSAALQRRVEAALAATRLEPHTGTRTERLSGGLKRRLNLALSLVHEPKLLFLDEPTVGVDPQSRAFILDLLRGLPAQGMTLVYTSHYMEEVEQLCDRVAILDQGRVIATGALDTLLAQHDSLESLFLALTHRHLRD